MTWHEKLETILDYVEHHLQRTQQPLDSEEIAKLAECSYSFFQKVFSYTNGISFADYVRFRKLTLAGYALKSTHDRILDISYQFGYDSPTSFTKAFQQFHGIPPKEARKSEAVLMIYPKMQIDKKLSYRWRLSQLPSFRLIGLSKRISCQNQAHFDMIPAFWQECKQNKTFDQLVQLDNTNPQGLFGLINNFNTEKEEMDYVIAVSSSHSCLPNWTEVILPATSWAIFDCIGPAQLAIQQGWKFLNQEWLVQYPFAHAKCPELEWFSASDNEKSNYLSQIWIPIIEED